MGLNRKQFIESHGASCNNWRNSWSFINKKENFIIFGAWDSKTDENGATLIFSKSWEFKEGRKEAGYKESREHIRMIEEEGFELKTFTIIDDRSEEEQKKDTTARIKEIVPELEDKILVRADDENWCAHPIGLSGSVMKLPEEVSIDSNYSYPEGAVSTIQVNSYERNREARQRCLDHHGYSCAVCRFDFEKHYGDIGKGYIHVHHKTPIRAIGKEYQIDPISELIPVCPNCHAMMHKEDPPFSVKELKEIMKSQA